MTDSDPDSTAGRKIPVVSVVGTIALVLTLVLNAVVGLLLIVTRQNSIATAERLKETSERLAEYTTCTAAWQQRFGEAYRARVDASKRVDTALDAVVRAVDAQDPDAFARSVDRYVELRDQQATARAENPLPPLPEQLCGTPEEVRR